MAQLKVDEKTQSDPPCHAFACAIQECLSKANYDEAKCKSQIDRLYDCCSNFYKKNGDDASTVSCPKPNLLRLKVKQRQEASSAG